MDGIIRGWSPILPAGNMGEWQAIKLGVDRAPYGIPYWNDPEYLAMCAEQNAR